MHAYSYDRLVQFIDSYDPPLKGLHEDLNFISPRIGEVGRLSFSQMIHNNKCQSRLKIIY